MCRRLVLRMVSGMFGSLSLRQTTHCQNTEDERNRKELTERLVHEHHCPRIPETSVYLVGY